MIILSEAEILERLIAALTSRTRVTDVRAGGYAVQVLGAAAQLVDAAQQAPAEYAEGRNLDAATGVLVDDLLASLLPDGLQRTEGAFALGGTVTFSGDVTPADVTIPQGHVVYRGTGGVRYRTTAPCVKAAGATTSAPPVSVICERRGEVGNCAVGEINRLGSPITGISSVANTTAISTGTDRQEDADAIDTARLHLRSMAARTNAAILRAVRSVDSPEFGRVLFDKIDEAWSRPWAGCVRVYIDDGAGTAGTQTLVAGEVLSPELAGGEVMLRTAHRPIVPGSADGQLRVGGIAPATPYSVVEPLGEIRVEDGAAMVAGLDATLNQYSYYSGLVGAVQAAVDGAISEIEESPGVRANGALIQVLPAAPFPVSVFLRLAMKDGLVFSDYEARIRGVILAHHNGLGIGEAHNAARATAAIINTGLVRNVPVYLIDGVQKRYVPANSVGRLATGSLVIG